MAIDTNLQTAWNDEQTQLAIFQVRALMQNSYNEIQTVLTQINTLITGANFVNADPAIKAEGSAILAIMNTYKTALDAHALFLNWKPA